MDFESINVGSIPTPGIMTIDEFHYKLNRDTGEVEMLGDKECPICGLNEPHSHWLTSNGDIGSLVTFPNTEAHHAMSKQKRAY